MLRSIDLVAAVLPFALLVPAAAQTPRPDQAAADPASEPASEPVRQARAHLDRATKLRDQGKLSAMRRELRRAHRALRSVPEPWLLERREAYYLRGEADLTARHADRAVGALEKALAHPPGAEPPTDSVAMLARIQLAAARARLGDPARGAAEARAVLASLRDAGRQGGGTAQVALAVLAECLLGAGRLAQARDLYEGALAELSATRPPGHPHLMTLRNNLAVVLGRLGEHARAAEIQEALLEHREATLPADHPSLELTRESYARSLLATGRVDEARTRIEQVLATRTRRLGHDHAEVQAARANLALVLAQQGNLPAAEAVAREVLEAKERVLGPGATSVQLSRLTLASLLMSRGALADAAPLRGAAIAALEVKAPDSDKLLSARLEQADTLVLIGDFAAADEQASRALAAAERLSAPNLTRAARAALARVRAAQGQLEQAIELCDAAAGAELDPDSGGPDALAACLLLARVPEHPALPRALERAAAGLRSQLLAAHRQPGWHRLRLRAGRLGVGVDVLLSLADRHADTAAWNATLLELVELSRGEPMPMAGDAAAADRAAWGTAAAQLVREIRANASAHTLIDARLAVDRAERVMRAPHTLPVPAIPAAMCAALGPGEAAVAYRCYTATRLPDRGPPQSAPRWIAFVLRPAAPVWRVDLGPHAVVDAALGALRRAIEDELAWRLDPHAQRERVREVLDRLRALLWQPLGLAPDATSLVHLAPDGELQLVPFAALPDGAGCLGDRVDIAIRPTLAHLGGAARAEVGGDLLVVGPAAAVPAVPTLPHARLEVSAVQELFAQRHPEGAARTVATPTGAALHTATSGAGWVHFAAHGWFAPELGRPGFAQPDRAPSGCVPPDRGADPLPSWLHRTGAYTGLAEAMSPLAFCGLTLGPRPTDTITGEELLTLDLSGCRLAVLSACDSSLGYAISGRGLASLQTALHVAGARAVLGARWRVGDAATRAFTTAFYRALWSEGQTPVAALRTARQQLAAARGSQGAPRWPWRDWAAWSLVGT